MFKRLCIVAVACVTLCGTAVGDIINVPGDQPTIAGEPELAVELVAQVGSPIQVTHAPGDFERLFVISKDGTIHVIKDGAVLAEPFLDLSDIVLVGGPQGLLTMAFHPQYQSNGFFYVNYTNQPNGDNVVARYQVTADPDVADPDSAQVVITMPQDHVIHNLEWIGFGPNDGYLYLAAGENNIGARAQDLDSLEGKILRLDVDSDDFPGDPERNYGIPPDNPFVGVDGADEIWAYGLRNPWRCSFDRETGDFYIADVGSATWEEVNFQPADSTGGENYGWKCKEANSCTGDGSCERRGTGRCPCALRRCLR